MTMRSRSRHRGGRRSATTLCERKAVLGRAPVFLNRFDWPTQTYGGRFGAVHGVDVPLSFHNAEAWPPAGNGPEAHSMANKMPAAWVTFARTGNPGGQGLLEWPAYDTNSRPAMIFDVESRVENNQDAELLARAQS